MTLRGDPSLARSKVSLKAMIKILRKEGGGIPVEYNNLEGRRIQEGEIPGYLRTLMTEFEGVFDQPQGLPPDMATNTLFS